MTLRERMADLIGWLVIYAVVVGLMGACGFLAAMLWDRQL